MRLVLAVFLTLIIGTTSLAQDVKSVILLVGTGLGSVQLDLTRNYAGGTLNIDKLPEQGRLKTGSANSPVPDAQQQPQPWLSQQDKQSDAVMLTVMKNSNQLPVMKNKGGELR